MPDLLSGREPTITRADAHGQTYWCLRTFGFESLAEAKTMCLRMLGASGLRCWARARAMNYRRQAAHAALATVSVARDRACSSPKIRWPIFHNTQAAA